LVTSILASVLLFPLVFLIHVSCIIKKTRPLWEGAFYAPQKGVNHLYNMRTC
jgi:hypothetical protein